MKLILLDLMPILVKVINNNYLFLLSLIIFLSPTFRSLAIWPDSRLPGLIFFVLTIYFFLKFKKKNELKYTWYTCLSLVVSSYIKRCWGYLRRLLGRLPAKITWGRLPGISFPAWGRRTPAACCFSPLFLKQLPTALLRQF